MRIFLTFIRPCLFLTSVCAAGQQLTYSTVLSQNFNPSSITADTRGNILLAGALYVSNLLTNQHAFVTKLASDGKSYLYTRDLGPANGNTTSIAVDVAGNAYITGSTSSSNPPFQVTTTGPQLGSWPDNSPRMFLVKLDPQGEVVFSELIGGAISGTAIAVTASGDILLSGTSASGLKATLGAYSVIDTANRPFLLKIDPTGSNVIFCATGIGGSSLALDATGNIYIAGSTYLLDYPTTAGAYQTTFRTAYVTSTDGTTGFPGANQYVTKVDPTGSSLIYSTGLSSEVTTNTGLAVDPTGFAYVAASQLFPFEYSPRPSLTKLSQNGDATIFSVPVGGQGVALDDTGNVYVGGWSKPLVYSHLMSPVAPAPAPAGYANIPTPCLPNNLTGRSSATVTMLDPTDGSVKSTQWIDGSAISLTSMITVKNKVWVAGTTNALDIPFSPDSVMPSAPQAQLNSSIFDAFLGAADFSVTGPQIACILDSASLFHLTSVTPNQLISIFGSNLDLTTGSSVTFDGAEANVIYASPTQINVVVPQSVQTKTVMGISVEGARIASRQFSVTSLNPSLFAELIEVSSLYGEWAVVRNADHSFNSATNPATAGTAVSLYLNGAGKACPADVAARFFGARANSPASVSECGARI